MIYFGKFQEKSIFIPNAILQWTCIPLIRDSLSCCVIPNNNAHVGLGFKGLFFLEENLSDGAGSKNVHQGENISVLQHNTYLKQILWLILLNVRFGSE